MLNLHFEILKVNLELRLAWRIIVFKPVQNILITISSLKKYIQVIIRSEKFQRPYTPWKITMVRSKLIMTNLARNQNLFLKRFDGAFATMRFDEKSFFRTVIDFLPYWDY